VVHAPRAGEKIKISPIASSPILGAVRPDQPVKGTRDTPHPATTAPRPAPDRD
jgi:hypothetical protein